jgi:hypothetical protein
MKTLMTVMLLSYSSVTTALSWQGDSVLTDSTMGGAKRATVTRLTTRIHSAGFFNFSGRLGSSNPAIDLTFLYENQGFGASIFTARDLYDRHSENNFIFGVLYKRFVVTKKFSITPHVGTVMEGWGETFGDRVLVISSWKVSKRFTIDETTLVANAFSRQQNEWLNRLRIIFSQTDQLQFILSNWHNNAVFDESEYLSASLQASYSRIKVTDHAFLQTAVSYFMMAKSNEEISKGQKNGVVITVALNID